MLARPKRHHRLRPIMAFAAVPGALCTAPPAMAEESAEQTDPSTIVVTAASREQEVRNAPASISVITREELEARPYREVTDILAEVPGVTVMPGEGNSRDISIRGMDPKYTLILVDGKRLSSRESRTNGGNVSEGGMLPPVEAIERIEIVRGPMSSLYGSDAMGGVVNIITRRIGDQWRGSVRGDQTLPLDGDYGDQLNTSFYASGPISGGLGLQLQGQLSHRSSDHVIGGSPQRDDRSISAKLGFDLSDAHRFLLEGAYFEQEVVETAGQTVEAEEDEPAGTTSSQTQLRHVASLSHQGDWGFARDDSYIQYERGKHVEQGKTIDNIVAQSLWTVELPRNTMTIGAYYRNEDLYDPWSNGLSGSTTTGTTRYAWAGFVEDELRLTDRVRLTGGLRMDHDEQYGDEWTPRLYAVWNPTGRITLKGGYSQGFRAPNLRQTLADWGQTSRGGTIYGNPDLKAETSATYEASASYSTSGLSLSLGAYSTDFNDKITRVTCEAAGAWCVDEPLSSIGNSPTTYVNVDKARLRGIEATLKLKLTGDLTVNASGTITDSRQLTGDEAGAALNDTPKQQASASLQWKPDNRFNAYLRAIFRGEEAITEAQSDGDTIYAASYTTVDVGASYKLSPAITVRGGVSNIFDKQLDYEEYEYLIDPARLWLGASASF